MPKRPDYNRPDDHPVPYRDRRSIPAPAGFDAGPFKSTERLNGLGDAWLAALTSMAMEGKFFKFGIDQSRSYLLLQIFERGGKTQYVELKTLQDLDAFLATFEL